MRTNARGAPQDEPDGPMPRPVPCCRLLASHEQRRNRRLLPQWRTSSLPGIRLDIAAEQLARLSLLLILLILLHSGRGGGLSDMFGGGVSSSLGGSSVAERNLDRLTVGIGVIWFACVIALGLLLAYQD